MSPDAWSKLVTASSAIGVHAMSAHANVIIARQAIDRIPDRARERVAEARADLQTAIDAIDDAIAAMDGAPPERVVETNVVHLIAAE